MACTTCSHTMQGVGHGVFWCPRCGTIQAPDPGLGTTNFEAPRLVERCREFEKAIGPEWMSQCGHLRTEWKRLGIAESIRPESDRGPA